MTARRPVRLSDALRACGWKFVRCDRPRQHPDRLGKPARAARAAALSGGRVAMRSDSWSLAYDVSHEIAEALCGFRHGELLFTVQANLLATWHAIRSGHVKASTFYRPTDGGGK